MNSRGTLARRRARTGTRYLTDETAIAETVAIVLAGGRGSRLGPLTADRCKPALPFGGRFRCIDFTLSNCVNSGLGHVGVAAQYRAGSLLTHLERCWGDATLRQSCDIETWLPRGDRVYGGTADAVCQNLAEIDRHAPRYVLVLAADHVYRMDYGAMLRRHRQSGADVTILCQPVRADQANQFGILAVRGDNVVEFREKPLPEYVAADPVASLGVYVFDAALLRTLLRDDATRAASRHDFGHDIIPACVRAPDIKVVPHPLRDPVTGGRGYWCDIGTVDAYWAAHMELLANPPSIELRSTAWPIRPAVDNACLAGDTRSDLPQYDARVTQSLIGAGCRIDGAIVRHSVLFDGVHVAPGSVIEDCVLLPGARVGRNCRLRRTIVDVDTNVASHRFRDGSIDRSGRGYDVSAGGVAVLYDDGAPYRHDEPADGQRPATLPQQAS